MEPGQEEEVKIKVIILRLDALSYGNKKNLGGRMLKNKEEWRTGSYKKYDLILNGDIPVVYFHPS